MIGPTASSTVPSSPNSVYVSIRLLSSSASVVEISMVGILFRAAKTLSTKLRFGVGHVDAPISVVPASLNLKQSVDLDGSSCVTIWMR